MASLRVSRPYQRQQLTPPVVPASSGNIGLGELFEMWEECIRGFGLTDVYEPARRCGTLQQGGRPALEVLGILPRRPTPFPQWNPSQLK